MRDAGCVQKSERENPKMCGCVRIFADKCGFPKKRADWLARSFRIGRLTPAKLPSVRLCSALLGFARLCSPFCRAARWWSCVDKPVWKPALRLFRFLWRKNRNGHGQFGGAFRFFPLFPGFSRFSGKGPPLWERLKYKGKRLKFGMDKPGVQPPLFAFIRHYSPFYGGAGQTAFEKLIKSAATS